MRSARIATVNTRIARASQSNEEVLALAEERIHAVSRDTPDLVLLSEIFANRADGNDREAVRQAAEPVPGPLTERLGSLAARYRTYIALGMYRLNGEKVRNSLVLLDRSGTPVWHFDKVTPTIGEVENSGVVPGRAPEPYDCDFGRIGGCICFDVHFLELAEHYLRQRVELILFASAFPGGKWIDTWATMYGFTVACSTYYRVNRILDPAGAILNQTSDYFPGVTAHVNLNRRKIHIGYNMPAIEKLKTDCGGSILIEDCREEAMVVISSLEPGLEIDPLLDEYGIERLDAYFDRSRTARESGGGLRAKPGFQT